MDWLIIALAAYFLGALAIILDKFLLGSGRFSSPPVYSFYISLLGLGALIFLPFGFYIPSDQQIAVSLLSGILFTFGILSLYYAISKAEASRVAPVVGAVIPVISYFFSIILFGEELVTVQISGFLLLIFGGLLISFDLPLRINKRKFFAGFEHAILAGILLAGAYVLFKCVYQEQNFFNGFIWTRFGSALGIVGLFAVPRWRKDIFKSFKEIKKPTDTHYRTGFLLILNKIIGGTSSILLNYGFKIGSVTLINALVSSQYVFVLILATAASFWHPKVFREKLYFWDWAQKAAAIAIIAAGIYLISINLSSRIFPI